MIRNLLRSTLAEQLASKKKSTTFSNIGWRLQALLTSQNYDDFLFNKTKRFRTEEVYLLDSKKKILLSFASRNPSRHVSPARIKSTYTEIKDWLLSSDFKNGQKTYTLKNGQQVTALKSKKTLLIAISQGLFHQMALHDLDYIHQQADELHASSHSKSETMALLQPLLENALLIQSPIIPN